MDTLTNDEIAEIFHQARAEVGDQPNAADKVNTLVKDRVERVLQLRELRRRVELELQNRIW